MSLLPRPACLRPLAAAAPPPSPRHLKEHHWPAWGWRFHRKHEDKPLAPPETCAAPSPECLWAHSGRFGLSSKPKWASWNLPTSAHPIWCQQEFPGLRQLKLETDTISARWFQHEHPTDSMGTGFAFSASPYWSLWGSPSRCPGGWTGSHPRSPIACPPLRPTRPFSPRHRKCLKQNQRQRVRGFQQDRDC